MDVSICTIYRFIPYQNVNERPSKSPALVLGPPPANCAHMSNNHITSIKQG